MTTQEFLDGLKDIIYRWEIEDNCSAYIVDDVKDLVEQFIEEIDYDV
jgi:hypothetical protein